MSGPQSMLPDPQLTMEVRPLQVAEWIALPADQRPCLVDCREQSELDICRIEGCEWIALAEFPTSLKRLEAISQRGMVVYCHHGMRSMHAVAFLRTRGIEASFSMAGGIEQWAREVDKDMARY